ncbi:MAG: T9SS type A sorting domain-containing protein [Bacteroidia bacterium]
MKYLSLIAMCCFLSVASAQTTYEVSTFAGNGTRGNRNGPSDSATFGYPRSFARDAQGNIYVSDNYYHNIRKITPSGIISNFAGSGTGGYKDGPAGQAQFKYPSGICFDKSGNLLVADFHNNVIRKVDPNGTVSTFAGTAGKSGYTDGNLQTALFDGPRSIFVDSAGNIYVGEAAKVRKITPAGQVITLAGGVTTGYQDGTGSNARFYHVHGIVADNSGIVYVAELTNNAVRKITPDGTVSTVLKDGPIKGPMGILINDSGHLIVTSNTQILKITTSGIATSLAGTSASTSTMKDGVGSDARFVQVAGIMQIGPNEYLISDISGSALRRLNGKAPLPPKPEYLKIPASLCMGSTVSFEPSTTGSIPELTLKADSLELSAAKLYHRHNTDVYIVNANDSILRYDLQGNLQQVYNDLPYLTGIRSIVADDIGRLYIVAIDLGTTYPVVYRFNADGSWDISWQTPMYYFTGISGMTMGPDGYLYVTDSVNLVLEKVDTATAMGTKLYNANSQYSLYKPAGLSFDKSGTLYIADVGHNNILRRDPTNGNFHKVFPDFDTLQWNISQIEIDKTADDLIMQASSGGRVPYKTIQIAGLENTRITDYADFVPGLLQPAAIFEVADSGKVPVYWVLNSGANNLKKYEIYAYTITPQLPAGLRYNFSTGEIYGTPTAASPAKAYIIKATSNFGTNSDTIIFGVNAPGPINNTAGINNSPVTNHPDGFTIQYFKENDCEKIMDIQDSVGGNSPGKVQVSQTVSTIASFKTGKFVGRVTEINTQNPNAQARLKLYFTYQDIVNYNANNGVADDLSNDTSAGTMEVALLQLHTDSNGRTEFIKHNPITATWLSGPQNWLVNFPVEKFSVFYMGDPVSVDAFDCSNSGSDSIGVQGDFYYWETVALTTSGTYYQTLVNKDGCDSFATLKLTMIPDSSTGFSKVLYSNTSVHVYPNPGTGIFDLEIKNLMNIDYTISVVNTMGLEVYETSSDGNSQLDLRHLPDGIYFIRITGGNVQAVSRIVKQQQ